MRIFSGIQPTGRKHLGNYIGAIVQYVASQDRGEGIFCIVDLHATTVAYDPAELRERPYDTAATLLAAGLDPKRCTLFRQSDVPEHTELTWLLCSVTELGRLQRMHQFRDKSLAQRELVSAGLLLYPVLQAADVLEEELRADAGPRAGPTRRLVHRPEIEERAQEMPARLGVAQHRDVAAKLLEGISAQRAPAAERLVQLEGQPRSRAHAQPQAKRRAAPQRQLQPAVAQYMKVVDAGIAAERAIARLHGRQRDEGGRGIAGVLRERKLGVAVELADPEQRHRLARPLGAKQD